MWIHIYLLQKPSLPLRSCTPPHQNDVHGAGREIKAIIRDPETEKRACFRESAERSALISSIITAGFFKHQMKMCVCGGGGQHHDPSPTINIFIVLLLAHVNARFDANTLLCCLHLNEELWTIIFMKLILISRQMP